MSILEVLDLPDDFPLGVDDASKDGATVLLQLRDVNGQSVQHEDEDSVRQGDRTASAYAGIISDRQALTCEDPSFVSTSKDFSGCTDSSLRVIPLVAISVVFFFAILYRSEFVLPSDSSLTDAWKQMVVVLVALVIGVVGLVYPVTLKAVSTALLQSRTVNGQSVEHRSGTREGGISASANA
jgi:hypothetical protein